MPRGVGGDKVVNWMLGINRFAGWSLFYYIVVVTPLPIPKRLLLRGLFLFLFFPILTAGAQAPYISWQKCLGGPYLDYGGQVMPTTDGGSIAVGYVGGGGGDVVGLVR